jgi:Secretion system C-terminal sorting domain
MMKKITFLLLAFLGISMYSYSQVSLCADAVPVSLPYTSTDDTANYADTNYEGSPGATGCNTTSPYLGGNNVVYAYTATSDTSIKINLTSTNTWKGMFVYNDCANIGLACAAGASTTGAGPLNIESLAVTNGQTYYIVLGTWPAPQTMAYTITITENTCTNPSATYAIVSNCDSAPEFFVDVDVTSLGSASSLTIADNQGSATQSVSSTGIAQFGPYPNATNVVFTTTNDQDATCLLTSANQTQAVCPPDCSTATEITACEEVITADFIAGPGAWDVPACGFTTPGVENVYRFTPTVDGLFSLEVISGNGWVDYYYKEASGSCDTSGWTCINDVFATGTNPIGTLTAGTEYLFLLDSEGTTARTHTFKILCPPTCTDATVSYATVSDCDNAPQFFVDVNITDLGTATSITVSDDQGSATQNVTATGVIQFGPYPNATPVIFTVANDQDATCELTSPVQNQLVCPPSNDLCSGAIDLGLETSPLSSTTVGATNNNAPTCGFGNASPDVYYSLLVANGSTLTIQQTDNSYDSVVNMFYGDCSTPTAITCYDDPDDTTTVWANTTGTDQTVYVVIDGYGSAGQSGTFTLAWSVVACSNATANYTIVSDCTNAPQFFVDVNVTDLGSASSLTVSDNQASAPQAVTAAGTVQFGPYPNATSVVFTVTNDQDASCTVTSAAQTQAVCPPDCSTATVLDCNTDTVADFVAGPGAWTFASAFPGPGTGCNYATPGVEKIYSFTPATTGVYSVEVTSAGSFNFIDYLYKEASGSCDTTGWTCIDDVFEPGTYSIGTLTAGTEYLILLDSEVTTALSQTFKIVCPLACTEPTATFNVISNCAIAAEFFVIAEISNLGSATTLTVSDNHGSATQTVSAAGTVQFGPYALGTSVVLTLTNDQLTTCTLASAPQTQAECPPSCATLTTPANMATNVVFATPGVVGLAWTAPTTGPTPTTYTIMWGTSVGTMVALGNTPNTAVNITNVPYNTTFYWSAVPNFTSGSVTGCTVFSFTTQASPGFCLNGAQWPTATFLPTCSGATENITTGGWAGEYSRVTVASGVDYTFTSSVATDFITISNAAGTTAIVFGTTPVTWTSNVDGDIRFYTHISDQCGTQNTDRTRAISCPNLATDTFDNANFTFRPNPVVDVLNLQYNKAITSVSVYNIVGQEVIAKTVNANMSQVDMSALPSGTYMVKVTSNNEVKTIKVVKE